MEHFPDPHYTETQLSEYQKDVGKIRDAFN